MQMPHTSCLESKSSISLILSGRLDLDPRPEPWQDPALPAELLSQNEILIIYLALPPKSQGKEF